MWTVIGAIAQATSGSCSAPGYVSDHPDPPGRDRTGGGDQFDDHAGRFFLGVGSGENLNEHTLGDYWPAADERQEMLEEAIEIFRLLWQGGSQTHRGKHYRVEKLPSASCSSRLGK